MSRDSGARRFGGRWVREGQQYQERFKGVRMIFGRFWYLLVPFLGIMCANDSYVRPVTEDVKSVKNKERAVLLDQKDDIRAQVSTIQTETQTVSDEIDTLYAPQIEFYEVILDSLIQRRSIYDRELPLTRAKVESLRTVRDGIAAELAQLASQFQDRKETLANLEVWHATMVDSIAALDLVIAERSDELQRTRSPLEFRRREALITGEGEYPRRDENPPRDGGQ